eukprot:gnl/MRDRNA2_/MRDRNA2_117465_c0_seq1.p1 gnl/MRDRNA2_/MRDRNA2_117465_c0~~gnl/MRDRNA2_/MRDRNA2_117465_c0_seq1.p1  ORF type:complete len:304 (-),score=67.10 gnl/MRDRNA2_/MRDRNA2_117465_c0_seq1:54-965(-)
MSMTAKSEERDLGPELIEISLGGNAEVSETQDSPAQIADAPQTIGAPQEIDQRSSSSSNMRAVSDLEAANEKKLIRLTKITSMISVVTSFALGLIAFGTAIADEALALAGLGGEMMLDGISSMLVYWRFKTPKARQFDDAAEQLKHKLERDARRERNSSLLIGITFVFLACILCGSAVYKLRRWDAVKHLKQEQESASIGNAIAWPSFFIFGGLSIGKLILSKKLHSRVLSKDALCSGMGALLSLIVAVSAAVEDQNSNNPEMLNQADGFASLLIAVILLADGTRTIQQNASPGKTQAQHLRF